jgi:HTH-type transcriptional regulator / antitoxin HipB
MNAIVNMVQVTLRTAVGIGALTRARRKALGLDQIELAERVGVSRLWINQLERGKPGASLGLVLRTFSALGLELTTDDDVKPKANQLNDQDAVTAELRRRMT